ncbi:MAG: ROK family protein, partial [Limisphaerales bacterium]
MKLTPRHIPALDPGFTPAALWNREFRKLAAADPHPFAICVERNDGTRSACLTELGADDELNLTYAERLLKFLLWQKGGYQIYLGG